MWVVPHRPCRVVQHHDDELEEWTHEQAGACHPHHSSRAARPEGSQTANVENVLDRTVRGEMQLGQSPGSLMGGELLQKKSREFPSVFDKNPRIGLEIQKIKKVIPTFCLYHFSLQLGQILCF